MKAQRTLKFSSPIKSGPSVKPPTNVTLSRSPVQEARSAPRLAREVGTKRSPVKLQATPFLGRGIVQSSHATSVKQESRSSQRNSPFKVARHSKVEGLFHMALSAYASDSPYAIKPPDLEKFRCLITDTQVLVDAGVPDNTTANENSAVTRYWVPFCAQHGIPHVRPPYLDLNSNQRKFEDFIRASALPWMHLRMPGKKHARALDLWHFRIYNIRW